MFFNASGSGKLYMSLFACKLKRGSGVKNENSGCNGI